jgi:sulfatase maturation enzyme AslB (radical SAM superfamily)
VRELRVVTAPFLAEQTVDGIPYLSRRDPGASRTAVRLTALVRGIIDYCRSGRSLDDLGRRFAGMAGSESAVESIALQLVDLRLLVDLDHVEVIAPSIELEITNRCNASCVMCPREELRPLADMDRRTVDAVVELIRSYPCTGVLVQGIGEPTLHADLIGVIGRLRSELPPDVPVGMVTNGFLMSPTLLRDLRDAGLTFVQWSFHSADRDVYDKTFGRTKFDSVSARLEACTAEHADMIFVNAVVTGGTNDGLADLETYLAAKGVLPDRIHAIPVFSRGGTVDSIRLGAAQRPTVGRCVYVKRSMFIAANGDLLPCSNDIRGSFRLGNVGEMSPGAVLAAWRELLSAPKDFAICRGCDHHTRSNFDTEWFGAVHVGTLVARYSRPDGT